MMHAASEVVNKIVKRDIDIPGCPGKLAFILDNVLTKQECEEYIRKTEEKGYEQAKINVGGGVEILLTEARNSSRCIWDSFEETGKLWERMKPYIPPVWSNRNVLGLNERMRFLRYDPGEYFRPHFDGSYMRDNGERSYITIQLYLNEGFEGGSTVFLEPFSDNVLYPAVPKTGSVLIFQHDIFHEGEELRKGRKYTMRTDVMYGATCFD